VPVEHVGSNFHVIMPVDRDPNRLYLLAKRVMDLGIALLGGAAMIVLLPFVALATALESPGPLFYRQVRVGRGGRLFEVIKFRTMVPNAEAEGPRWAAETDERITRVGRVLRRLRLDELPQVINVLRGDMSIIASEEPDFAPQPAPALTRIILERRMGSVPDLAPKERFTYAP
jgi:lipopolysaccharide/colanic/teichoic acid biosynthesis glycosyltransferase